MAAIQQLYGIDKKELEGLSQKEADHLLRSAYQAYVEAVGKESLAGRDPYASFVKLAATSGSSLRRQIRSRLDHALKSVRSGRF